MIKKARDTQIKFTSEKDLYYKWLQDPQMDLQHCEGFAKIASSQRRE
jgi:hypothetical protein